ncbi:MAG: endonuclease domain-containing protein [Thermodesulfobacteriota bacterium]
MPKTIPKQILTTHAKSLRHNATQAERTLWRHLRAKQMDGIKFRRQQPIENYIVDLVSFEKRLVIELDGGQHAQHKEKDIQRDRFLVENGFKVLRFWNNEVLSNIDGVLETIRRECLK